MDIAKTMTALASKRPLFHSEADFQHALAWEIHTAFPDARVRLEYRPPGLDRMYVDLWVQFANGGQIAFELKYKTRAFSIDHLGEPHELLNQSAQDQARYDFLRDVFRLEYLKRVQPSARAFAIFLTNDPSYWSASRSLDAVDSAFRLHEGRFLSGRLGWGRGASAGTIKSRETVIILNGVYDVKWHDYSTLDPGRKMGLFRFTSLEVAAPTEPVRQPV